MSETETKEEATEAPPKDPNMVTLTIDGEEITVPKGTNVLEAAKTIGTEISSFCYHPGLSIAANRCTRGVQAVHACHPRQKAHTGSAVVLNTVRSAKLDCICATPGSRARCWRWMRAKSSVFSATTLRI